MTAITTTVADHTVYGAERTVTLALEHVTPDNPFVVIDGQTYAPEPEAKFTDVADVERYVTKVLTHLRDGNHDFHGRQDLDVAVRVRAGNAYAHYDPTSYTIEIPPRDKGGHWALRELVVLHEIAHHLNDTSGHGPGFRHTFLRLLEATGMPVVAHMLYVAYAKAGLEAGELPCGGRLLDKIAKLLNMAENASTQAEADAFMSRAQSLASAESIALAIARAHTAKGEKRAAPEHRTITVAERGAKGRNQMVNLALAVTGNNDLKCTISGDTTRITAYGFPEDLDVAELLFASLSIQMTAAAQAYLASDERKQNTERRFNNRTHQWEDRPINGLTARLAFYDGYTEEIGSRLYWARRDAEIAAEEAERDAREAAGLDPETGETPNLPVGTAVAIRQKQIEVHDYYEACLKGQRLGSYRGSRSGRRSSAATRTAAHAGYVAAKTANLGRGPAAISR